MLFFKLENMFVRFIHVDVNSCVLFIFILADFSSTSCTRVSLGLELIAHRDSKLSTILHTAKSLCKAIIQISVLLAVHKSSH